MTEPRTVLLEEREDGAVVIARVADPSKLQLRLRDDVVDALVDLVVAIIDEAMSHD